MVDRDKLMQVARDVEGTILDPSDILLTGKAAVVTGGGGGIGDDIKQLGSLNAKLKRSNLPASRGSCSPLERSPAQASTPSKWLATP